MEKKYEPSLEEGASLPLLEPGLCSFGGALAGFWSHPPATEGFAPHPLSGYPEYTNLVTSNGNPIPARCLFIEGTVVNRSRNTVLNADVFGRLYDANGNEVLPERTRLGAIEEVPPGESPFSIRISVPVTSPLPLTMEQFKASGFSGTVRR